MSSWVVARDNGPRCRRWKCYAQYGSGDTRRRVCEMFEGTKRDAIAHAHMLEDGIKGLSDPMSFSEFAHGWNDARLASKAIAKNTHEQYLYLINGLSMHIGGVRMPDLSARDIEMALTALGNGDTPSGKPWGGTTLRAAYKACGKVCRESVSRGMSKNDPTSSVTAPKNDTERRKALGLDESARLIDALKDEGAHGFACSLMLCTGMRAGECMNTRWSDVGGNRILVRREVTKSAAGERVIPLDDATMKMVDERRAHVEGFLSRFGHRIEDGTMLCCTDDGRPLTYNAMKHWWKRNRARLGMDGWTLHELRHTFATNLAQAGVHPSVMAALLGHSSSEITMEIYTHVHSADSRNAMDALASARNAK